MSFSLGNSNKSSFDACASWLTTVLKDHNSVEATALSRGSYKDMNSKEASQQVFDINNVEVREVEDYSSKPAHFVITNTINAETKSELLTALE